MVTFSVFLCFLLTTGLCNVSAQSSCAPYPSNWVPQNISTRLSSAHNVVYAKVVEKMNTQAQTYGETYDVKLELECDVKINRGIIIPEVFTVKNLGATTELCANREVETYQYYILFLTKDDNNNFILEEVNQQEAVVLASWDNLKPISSSVQKCLTDICNPAVIDGWETMTELERAEQAEMIVHVKITETHSLASGYYVGNAQLICGMKVPSEITLENSFNISQLGEAAGTFGQCADDHVTKGHEFIIFLERHFPFFPPLVGTMPPELLNNYLLGVEEVNFQKGIFNVTDEVKATFQPYLKGCPSSSARIFDFKYMISVILFNCAIIHLLVNKL